MTASITDVTVYMRSGARGGDTHEHRDVNVMVANGALRVQYAKTRIIVGYPLDAVEYWKEQRHA